jgi:dTDP-4-dehydrorhamnose 3,5-epimerase
MIFHDTALAGAFIIDPERHEDDRGFFARTWSLDEFRARGLRDAFVQCSISFNHRQGTLRGMHYQAAPYAETKLIRCTAGAIHDVIIDLRPDSPTFRSWVAVHLSADNRRMLYIPEGFGHGFQTLAPSSEVFYQITAPYVPESARGVRWNDPAFGITWPDDDRTMSARDRDYADFRG